MSSCPHGDGAHYLGDCGDMLDYIALPAARHTACGQATLDALTASAPEVFPPMQCPNLGPLVVSRR